jgi:hypothetical protein
MASSAEGEKEKGREMNEMLTKCSLKRQRYLEAS